MPISEPQRPAAQDSPAGSWQARLLDVILRASVVAGVVVCAASVFAAYDAGLYGLIALDLGALATVAVLWRRRRLPYRWRAGLYCLVLYALAAGLLVSVGPTSQVYLFGFTTFTTLLLGLRAGFVSSVLSALTLLVVGLSGVTPSGVRPPASTWVPVGWVVITLNFAFVNVLLTLAIGGVLRTLDEALQREIGARVSLERERTILRTLFDSLPDAIFTKDTAGRYINANPAGLASIGLAREADIIGKRDEDILPDDIARAFQAVDARILAGEVLPELEDRVVRPDGQETWFLVKKVAMRGPDDRIVGLIGIGRDITQRRALEEQLRQSQKMEAVGRLAGGVAHDFNNLLTLITGYSELLLGSSQLSPDVRESVRAIRDAGDRASALTRQLLGFSRQSLLQPVVLDLNATVADTGAMLRRLIGEHITLTTALAPGVPSVRVDPGQLNQVLMNLVLNARDAMPEGGRLRIETAAATIGDDRGALPDECHPGDYVRLSIIDTGCGMSPEVQARIFEPFFTTTDVGAGTGLGLAMVFGVVRQSGGGIDVHSRPGQGTRFDLYFPVADVEPPAPAVSDPVAGPAGAETVLLVEDEAGVRALASMSLRLHGYTVLEARDGHEALRLAATHGTRIQLVLTDVVMPHMGGPELVRALQAQLPGVRALFMSGYTDDAVVRHGVSDASVAFIQKPYTPDGLAAKVREVLDA